MNIVFIDDHDMLARALAQSLLEYDQIQRIQVLTKISEDIVETLLKKDFDIVLLDINLGKDIEQNGLDLAREILTSDESARIVFLTAFSMPMYEKKAKDLGARGFVSKDKGIDYLVKKLDIVNEGGLVFSESNESEALTPGEEKVLRLYCSGLTRKEVAEKTYMSLSSLAVILNRVYSKLGVNNYQELYRKALEEGYIKIDFI